MTITAESDSRLIRADMTREALEPGIIMPGTMIEIVHISGMDRRIGPDYAVGIEMAIRADRRIRRVTTGAGLDILEGGVGVSIWRKRPVRLGVIQRISALGLMTTRAERLRIVTALAKILVAFGV